MSLRKCDLCDQIRKCVEKEIEGRLYEICLDCWSPLERKLTGKGRPKDKGQIKVYLPPPPDDKEEDEEPFPGKPPKIW